MHIALVSPAWPPSAYPNGIVTYVGCMRDELKARGHRVSVFSGLVDAGHAAADVHAVKPGWPARIVRSLGRRLSIRRWQRGPDIPDLLAAAIRRLHARDPVDVIEMEESFGWVADVARRVSPPVVCKLHGPAFMTLADEELNTAEGQQKVRREGEALRCLPVIVSPSNWVLSAALERYQLSPAIAERVVNPLRSKADLPLWDLARCDRNAVLFVGRFDRIKGADLMIHAFQRLLAEKPGLELIFVGPDLGLVQDDGSRVHLPQFLESLADPVLTRAVSFRGRLEPAQITALRPTAFVTVVASLRENQPFAALEAMVQACPLVCTDTAGLSEMIDHGVTGLKARPQDAADLAAQIKRLIDDPALAQAVGRAGREHVLKHHASTLVAEQMLDVYRRAIALDRGALAPGQIMKATAT